MSVTSLSHQSMGHEMDWSVSANWISLSDMSSSKSADSTGGVQRRLSLDVNGVGDKKICFH